MFKCKKMFNRILFCLIIMAIFSTTINLHAQTVQSLIAASDVRIVNDSINQKVHVELKANNEILNLLVLISNSSGQTIFLDNRYHFKGDYKHSVDLTGSGKGRYFLKIIGDEKHFDKSMSIE